MSEAETKYWAHKCIALQDALKAWPKLPDPRVLKSLGSCAKWPEDNDRGKIMQRELGLSAIPPKCECEGGAGFWDRITQGAWRNAQP